MSLTLVLLFKLTCAWFESLITAIISMILHKMLHFIHFLKKKYVKKIIIFKIIWCLKTKTCLAWQKVIKILAKKGDYYVSKTIECSFSYLNSLHSFGLTSISCITYKSYTFYKNFIDYFWTAYLGYGTQTITWKTVKELSLKAKTLEKR